MAGWISNLFGRKNANLLDISRVISDDDPSEEPKPLTRAERENSFMEVVVVTDYGYKRKGVAIDVSDTGARLRFHTSESLPPRVRLKIPKVKVDCLADVIWHNGVDVGVRFG